MPSNAEQETYTDQVRQLVLDFLRLETRFRAVFPKELAEIEDRLARARFRSIRLPSAKFELFYRISSTLYRERNLTMGELSHPLSVPLSTATRMVDWQVDNGYATRLADPEDRRIVRVALTDSGRRVHEAVERFVVQQVQQILSELTSEEQRVLFALFYKLASTLEKT